MNRQSWGAWFAALVVAAALLQQHSRFGVCGPPGAAAVLIRPSAGQVSVPPSEQVQNETVFPYIPLSALAKTAPGCAPEQVRLTFWGGLTNRPPSVSVLVSWATCDAQIGPGVTAALDTSGAQSVVWLGTAAGQYATSVEGVHTSYFYASSAEAPQANYASPILHHVLLKGLRPGKTYYYLIPDLDQGLGGEGAAAAAAGKAGSGAGSKTSEGIGGQRAAATKPEFGANPFQGSFKAPAARFPLRIAVLGDPGQIANSSAVIAAAQRTKPRLTIALGDLAYSDIPKTPSENPGIVPAGFNTTGVGVYQPRWDTFGRLAQPLFSRVPVMTCGGNHEVQVEPYNAVWGDEGALAFRAYNSRYPVPQTEEAAADGPKEFDPVTYATRVRNLYYTSVVPGVATFITISTYGVDDFSETTPQYIWFKDALKKVNRAATPWLVVIVHTPIYTTLSHHFKEAECLRDTYESLWVAAGADLVISGHAHSYERIKPTVNGTLNNCGPMLIAMGNSGATGLEIGYIDQVQFQPPPNGSAPDYSEPYWYCQDPPLREAPLYQPQLCNLEVPNYCPASQPPWSAYRETAFGFGRLDLISARKAKWVYYRVEADGRAVQRDRVVVIRNPKECPSRRR